ncbi:MAG: recombinase family protein, partial [Lentisphaeria bacterium]|nr:recombinase family protein [Lentisphaeria bacterium]
MAKKKISAIIYARQSSGSDEQSDSVDTQEANCMEYCKRMGYEVKLVAHDLNTSGRTYPISGASVAEQDLAFQEWFKAQSKIKKYREGLDMALSFLGQGDVLVVDELTRIYRGIKNSYLGNYIKQMFIKNNVMVETVKAGRFDPRSFNDELIETVQSHVNDQQIRLGKQKSIEVRRRLTDDGVLSGGLRAVGLEYLGKHQYRIKDGYAEIINYVFTQILAYVPYSAI